MKKRFFVIALITILTGLQINAAEQNVSTFSTMQKSDCGCSKTFACADEIIQKLNNKSIIFFINNLLYILLRINI